MSLTHVSLSMILRLLFLFHLMTSFYSIEARDSLNVPTGSVLDDHNWIVLKEETITFLNNATLKAEETKSNDSKSVTDVKKSVMDNKGDSHLVKRNDTSEKDQSLFTCTNLTLKIGEYNIYDNGTLHVKAFRTTLNSSFYIQNGDAVTICKPTKKEAEISALGKALLALLTFAYTLITMLSAMCSFSKNSTYLKLALVSWICVSSNIFLWTIIILIIPGTESLFSWVSMSVNMNQSVYLTSAWMALLTGDRALKFLQAYGLIEIAKRTVTVKVGPIGILCVISAATLAIVNFILDQIAFAKDDAFIECLFCNPLTYVIVFLLVIFEGFHAPFHRNLSDVSLDYQLYHHNLCNFSIFNFLCIGIGTAAVMYEWHLLLWIYTLFNFLWPLFFVKHIIPRIQTLLAIANDEDETEEKGPISYTEYSLKKKGGELQLLKL